MSFFSHCDVKNLTEPCHNDIIRLVDPTKLIYLVANCTIMGGEEKGKREEEKERRKIP